MDRKMSRKELNEADALFASAERYEEAGEFKKAFVCLVASARLGHSSSQLNLANSFAAGTGVRKDLDKAAFWYRSAHRLGDTSAARNLAIDRLAIGNSRSAIVWFKKGIERKDGGSYVGLAKIYARRSGRRSEAIRLLEQVQKLNSDHACDLDREEAKQLLTELQEGLSITNADKVTSRRRRS
jgi:TPR repeat protein